MTITIKKRAVFALAMFGSVLAACDAQQRAQTPVIIHVIRDATAPFAIQLAKATTEFASRMPRLPNGRPVLVATNEGRSFPELAGKLATTKAAEVVILNAQSDAAELAAASHLGTPTLVCNGHPSYIPDWVSGESLNAAKTYLRFLAAECKVPQL
jgi:hypothetical protein